VVAVVVVVVAGGGEGGGGLQFFRGGKFEPMSTCYAHSLLLALSTYELWLSEWI